MKVVIAGSVAGGAVAVHICRPEAAACGELEREAAEKS